MNKTLAIIGGIIILALIGWGLYAVVNNSGNMATSTPSTTQTATVTQPANTPVVQTAGVPVVVTHSTVSATDNTAILNGTITPNGAFTTYWYEYGLSVNLGSKTNAQTVGSGFVSIQAPGYITGLSANTTYYFRLVGQNQYGTVSGTPTTSHSSSILNSKQRKAILRRSAVRQKRQQLRQTAFLARLQT